MYSPFTIATNGGGVGVAGTGVKVGTLEVGLPVGAKKETQAERPSVISMISCVKKMRGRENIVRIIPI